MPKTKQPPIASLSDLDPKTALATLAAMEYSDIIHLSYRQAVRLWVAVPSIRRKTYADEMRQVAARKPRVEWLMRLIDELEYARRYTPDSKGWFTEEIDLPSVLANKAWAAAVDEEQGDHMAIGGNCDWGRPFNSKTKSPDFIYSEDGTDLKWVG
jgi:hypothetical protein